MESDTASTSIALSEGSATFIPAFLAIIIPAYTLLDAPARETHIFGATMRLYTADEIATRLRPLGYHMIGHYGMRCLCDYLPDYLPDDGRKDDPAYFADLERLEHALASTHPYYLLARYFHLFAQRAVAG